MKHISKALRMARAEGITHYYLPPAHLSTNEKSHPTFTVSIHQTAPPPTEVSDI